MKFAVPDRTRILRMACALSVGFLFSQVAVSYSNATVVVTKRHQGDGARYEYTFQDSSFEYDEATPDLNAKSFCYFGNKAEVCGLIQKEVDAMMEDYASGDHDAIELESCSLKEGSDVVQVHYRLTDDYGGDISASRGIPVCDESVPRPLL